MARPDEFRHLCGKKLFDKYFSKGRMFNTNAVDADRNVHIGYTKCAAALGACVLSNGVLGQ